MFEGQDRWNAMRARRALIPPHVVSRSFSEETVLLNMQTGEYHGVDAIGARFLEVMAGQRDLAATQQVLATEYEQPPDRIAEDLVAFLEEMLARGLVTLEPSAG